MIDNNPIISPPDNSIIACVPKMCKKGETRFYSNLKDSNPKYFIYQIVIMIKKLMNYQRDTENDQFIKLYAYDIYK